MSKVYCKKRKLKEKPMSFLTLVIITGLTGGILLSSVAYLAYVFDFTTISPRIILEPWTVGEWKKSWLGTVIAILFMEEYRSLQHLFIMDY